MKTLPVVLALLLFLFNEDLSAQWKTESFRGPDGRQMEVHLYVPETPPRLAGKRALMINLHGCLQTNEHLRDLGNWEETADEYGMVVAIPDVPVDESYSPVLLKCWYYYDDDHTRTFRSNDNLISLARDLIAAPEYDIDPDQVYLSGLSSGGGETAVMGCLAPDIFAGIGINAGPTIGTGPNEIASVQTTKAAALALCRRFAGAHEDHLQTQLTSVIHGAEDNTVAQGYGDLNAEVMAEIYGADATSNFPVNALDGYQPHGQGTLWSDDGGPRVSLIKPDGLDHAWPAGSGPGGSRSYVRASGVNYPAYLAEFFHANNRRVRRNTPPELEIRAGRVEAGNLVVTGRAQDPDPGDAIASLVLEFRRGCNPEQILVAERQIVDTLSADATFSISTPWPAEDQSYVPVLTAADSHTPAASTSRTGEAIPVGDAPSSPLVNVSRLEAISEQDCTGIAVTGSAAQGSGELLRVEVQLDGGDFEETEGVADWRYRKCGLDYGRHEVAVRVRDRNDCAVHSAGYTIHLQRPYQEQSGTTLTLLSYFANYPTSAYPGAPSSGWGLCDKTYVELNSAFGITQEFTIYGSEDGAVWCLDWSNLPAPAPDIPPADIGCQEWSGTLATHESQGRVYTLGWWIWRSFIAKGSDIYLAGSAGDTLTLHERSDEPGHYYPGECN